MRELIEKQGGSWKEKREALSAIWALRGNQFTTLKQGKGNVYIDGTLKGTFDDYATTTKYGTAHTFTGLTDAVHTLAIRPLGTKQAASSGTLISVDRWIVT